MFSATSRPKQVLWVLIFSMLWIGCEELQQGTITVLSPDNKINWEVGLEEAAVITWQTGNVTGKLRINLMLDNESVLLIKDSVAASELEYCWTVPAMIEPGHGYSVFLESYDDSSAWAESKSFKINPYVSDSELDLLRPKKNEHWKMGIEGGAEIVWSTENLSGLLDLYLYQGATLIATIADSIPVEQENFIWTVPDTLNPDNNYHVMITAHEDQYLIMHGSTFNVDAPDNDYVFTVTSPTSNTRWEQHLNNGAMIEWFSDGLAGTVRIELMHDNTSLMLIADSIDIASTTYSWTVPLDIPAGSGYQVRLTSNEVLYMSAVSRQFRVDPYDATPILELTSPTRTDTWYIGEENSGIISWAYHNFSDSIKIELHPQNSAIVTITEDVAVDSGKFVWTIPDSVPAGKGYQIYIESNSNPELNDFSDRFDILAISDGAELNIISPERQTEWTIGDLDMAIIEWSSFLLDSTIRIELYERNNYLFTIEEAIDVRLGAYFWTVPNTVLPGKGYAIRLVSNRFPEIDSYSSNVSIITPEPTLTLLTPDKNAEWVITEPDGAYISWTSTWLDSTVYIHLYDNAEFLLSIAEDIDVNTGEFLWTIPETVLPGTRYKIILGSDADSSLNEMSGRVTLRNPTPELNILTPSQGDNWIIGDPEMVHISWISEWASGLLQIDLYQQNTFVATLTQTVDIQQGGYTWLVPDSIEAGKGHRIHLTSIDNPDLSDISSQFEISEPDRSLTLLTPVQNDEWFLGDNVSISWSSTWLDSTVRIDLYQKTKFLLNIFEDVDVSQGAVTWTVPDTLAPITGYRIYIQSNHYPEIDMLGKSFRISAP